MEIFFSQHRDQMSSQDGRTHNQKAARAKLIHHRTESSCHPLTERLHASSATCWENDKVKQHIPSYAASKILTSLLHHCCCRYPMNSCSKASVSFPGLSHHHAASRQAGSHPQFASFHLGREQVSWSKMLCLAVVFPNHPSQIRG